jgi:hypothetical protein
VRGRIYSKSIRKIEELIESVKIAYKVPLNLPLKWNMKDTKVEKLYRENGMHRGFFKSVLYGKKQ